MKNRIDEIKDELDKNDDGSIKQSSKNAGLILEAVCEMLDEKGFMVAELLLNSFIRPFIK